MKKIIAAIILAMGSLVLNGCGMMHLGGGMMSGDSHQHSGHNSQPEKERIVKEMLFGDYRFIAEFPPLQPHQPSLLSLGIYSSNNSLVAAARVRMRISTVEKGATEQIVVDRLLEPSGSSRYEYSFTPHLEATYNLTFQVERLEAGELDKPLILSATGEVAQGESNHANAHHTTHWMIMGGVLMTAMMVGMMAGGM